MRSNGGEEWRVFAGCTAAGARRCKDGRMNGASTSLALCQHARSPHDTRAGQASTGVRAAQSGVLSLGHVTTDGSGGVL